MLRDTFGEPHSNSRLPGGISEFDKMMHSPEAEASRQETIARLKEKKGEKSFPDLRSVNVSAGKGILQTLNASEKIEAIAALPRDVQCLLKTRPEIIGLILSGGTTVIERSNGAGEVKLRVSSLGIEVLESTRDS